MRPVRRGTTLVELLVVLVLTVGLSAIGTAMVRGIALASRRGSISAAESRSAAAGVELLRHELADAVQGDVTQSGAAQLRFSRQVGDAPVCASSGVAIWMAQSDWHGIRRADPTRDQLMLLPETGTSPWIAAGFSSIGASPCPDGRPGWKLTLAGALPPAVYLRIVEPVRFSVYRSAGADWLGLAPGDGSSPVQPFSGPLLPGAQQLRLGSGMLELDGRYSSGRPMVTRVLLGHGGWP